MTDKGYYYILDGKTPKQVGWEEYADFFENNNRVIEQTTVGDVMVSTVFLGIDHRHFFEVGEPILFETMIFGGDENDYQERYTTYDEAVKGHHFACELAFAKP